MQKRALARNGFLVLFCEFVFFRVYFEHFQRTKSCQRSKNAFCVHNFPTPESGTLIVFFTSSRFRNTCFCWERQSKSCKQRCFWNSFFAAMFSPIRDANNLARRSHSVEAGIIYGIVFLRELDCLSQKKDVFRNRLKVRNCIREPDSRVGKRASGVNVSRPLGNR